MGIQQVASIKQPGIWGINTNNTPSDLDPKFAREARNCILDREGKLTSRKHFVDITSTSTPLGSAQIKSLYYHRKKDGSVEYISGGNNKIMRGLTTLTDITPSVTPAIANDDWRIASLNGQVLFAQTGQEFFALDETTWAKTALTSFPGGIKPNDVEVMFNRAWVCDDSVNDYTVWWSDTLTGLVWSGGTAGSLNLMTVFTNAKDKVVACRQFNGLLVIFCRNSIIIYDGATTPSSMSLVEVISNVGCISRNTIVQVYNDLWFMSENGMQSLGRVIQEKSLPMEQKTYLVAEEFARQNGWIDRANMQALFYPAEAQVLVLNRSYKTIWCFNLQHGVSDDIRAITVWDGNIRYGAMCYDTENERLLVGDTSGIWSYTGYGSASDTYRLTYYTGMLDLGQANTLKHLKKTVWTITGGSGQACVIKWAIDYANVFDSEAGTLPTSGAQSEHGIAQHNIDEHSTGYTLGDIEVNIWRSGKLVQLGIETDVKGFPVSVLKLDVYSNRGKLR